MVLTSIEETHILLLKNNIWGRKEIRRFIWFLFIIASIISALPDNRLFGLNITFSDVLYFSSFYLICIMRMANKKMPLVILQSRYISIWYILFFVGLGTFFGLVRSTNWSESITYFIQYIFIFVILITVIAYLIDKNIKNAIRILGIWLIPHFISVAVILFSKLGLFNGLDEIILGGNGRYVGFYGIATSLGLSMTYVVVSSIFFFKTSRRFIMKIFYGAMILASLYALLLSGSFGALILLAISLLMVIWFNSNSKLFSRVFLMFITVFISITAFFMDSGISGNNALQYAPAIFTDRLEKSDGQLGSSSLRMDLNRQALSEFSRNPIFGVGADQFRHYNFETRNVHNTVISSAVETGVFGLIGTLIYLLTPIIYSRFLVKKKIYNKDTIEQQFFKYLFVLTLMRLAQIMFSGPYIQREAWIPFLTVIVLYSCHGHLLKVTSEETTDSSFKKGNTKKRRFKRYRLTW